MAIGGIVRALVKGGKAIAKIRRRSKHKKEYRKATKGMSEDERKKYLDNQMKDYYKEAQASLERVRKRGQEAIKEVSRPSSQAPTKSTPKKSIPKIKKPKRGANPTRSNVASPLAASHQHSENERKKRSS